MFCEETRLKKTIESTLKEYLKKDTFYNSIKLNLY